MFEPNGFSFLWKKLVGNVTSTGGEVAIANIGFQVLFCLSTGLNYSYFQCFQQVRVSFSDKIQKTIKHGFLKISFIDCNPRRVSLKAFLCTLIKTVQTYLGRVVVPTSYNSESIFWLVFIIVHEG